jgi:hypothetical protein
MELRKMRFRKRGTLQAEKMPELRGSRDLRQEVIPWYSKPGPALCRAFFFGPRSREMRRP